MDKLTPGGRSGAQPQRMQQMQQMQGPPTAVSGGGQQMAWNGNRWMEQQPNAQPMYERGMRPDGPAYDTYQPQPYRAPVSAGNRFAPIGSGGGMVPGPRQGLPAPVQSYAPQSDMVRAVGVPTTNRSAKIAG